MKRIYAIIDTLADTLVGQLFIFRHDAPAIRFFSDLISDPQTAIARHPKDHKLVCLGGLTDTNTFVAFDAEDIITGEQWLASQPPQEAA